MHLRMVSTLRQPRTFGPLFLALILACGSSSQAAPPSLVGLTPLCHVLADASWVQAVDNPATGDNAAAQFSNLEVLWSTQTMVLGDGVTYQVPAVPEPLEAWGFFQNIDQYDPADQLTLCLTFGEDHPYGQWRVTFALYPRGSGVASRRLTGSILCQPRGRPVEAVGSSGGAKRGSAADPDRLGSGTTAVVGLAELRGRAK